MDTKLWFWARDSTETAVAIFWSARRSEVFFKVSVRKYFSCCWSKTNFFFELADGAYLFLKSLSGFLTVWGDFYASKRIIQPKDFDANVHVHSVSSAVQRVQCPFGRRWIMCNPFQGSNSVRGAKNLFREIENCPRGANNLFRESENSFRGEIYNRLVRLYNMLFMLE